MRAYYPCFRHILIVLLVLCIFFICWMTLFDPVIGYANNSDFIRQSSCMGLWHNHADLVKTSGYPFAPSPNLIYDADVQMSHCVFSTDNFFAHIVALLHKPGAVVPYWQYAGVKLLCFATFFLLAFYLAGDTRVSAYLVFLLVFLDWSVLAYVNTMYAEFSVISAMLLIFILGAQWLTSVEKSDYKLLMLLVFSLCWLGLSKLQWSIFASLLCVIFAVISLVRFQAWREVLVFLSLGIALPIAYSMINVEHLGPETGAFKANKTNTFLMAVLPAANDQHAALTHLGLPEHCAVAIGYSWYSPELANGHPCPEVFNVKRSQLLSLFASQPSTFFTPVWRGLSEIRPLYPVYLGVIVPDSKTATVKLKVAQSIAASTWLMRLPEVVFKGLVVSVMLINPVLWMLLIKSIRPYSRLASELRGFLFLACLGGLTCGYAVFSSVFGDGYIEMQKHAVLFLPGLLAVLAAALSCFLWWLGWVAQEDTLPPRH